MRVLVTGGAGYIGSHVVRLLRDRGDDVTIVDDLETGDPGRVPGVDLISLRLDDTAAIDTLAATLAGHDAVIHFAARKRVDESVRRPAWYYQQNVGGMANLLLAMEAADVPALVFSSSAAVYGAAAGERLDESTPTVPINPYGRTKLIGEQMLDEARAATGLRAASLRYFNVAGAGRPELGDTAVLNLVPMVFEKLDQGLAPVIFGDDYPTPDGTCVRDYIHVTDLAEAHLAALDLVARADEPRHHVFNIGTGRGSSVREMVDMILEVSGIDIEPVVAPRRAGDPAAVVADPARARDELGWTARLTLRDIVESAWESHTRFANAANG
ncbi:UDP-glucose 4-epimerase GalE [Leifsonia shinshuensis]|uniref:UDP-glucose 4-epimerase n=1 Tax=Leifsonia shinshuensis TaxID=150026 RepID=A0A7G6Y9B9_9MICO|nr:UDP-glucose 4-epimerase GalE [Leifsonia shinshuensis]QNE35084.1 UDP-glucose 4-epimerase GalE [Leifsonia shinshuensis]